MTHSKNLTNILSLGNQYDKKSYLQNLFSEYEIREDKYGNIYVNKDFNITKPYICSHIDTVDEQPGSKTIMYDPIKKLYLAEREGKPCNLGADDGVGVYACIKLFKEFDVGLAFFLDEEKGCIGSSNADPNFINASYLLQLDRKGTGEIVFGTSWSNIASDEFKNDIKPIMGKYQIKQVAGGMTDVITLVENNIVNVSACNIACGYYEPHTKKEYISLDDMNKAINFARDILKELGNKTYYYEYADEYSFNMFSDIYYNQNGIRSYLQDLIDSNMTDDEIYNELIENII